MYLLCANSASSLDLKASVRVERWFSGEGTCHHIWKAEVDPWDPQRGRTELTSCIFLWHPPTTHTDKHIFSTLFLRHGWFLKELGAHNSANLATKRATGSTCLWLLVGTCRCVPPCPVFYMGAGNKPLGPHASRLCQLPSPITYGFQNASIISKYFLATKKG